MEDEDTLRSLSSQIEKEIPWTAQIEPEVLTRNIKTSEGILKSIVLTPVVIASGGNEGAVEPVYPYLEGFGSLDVSEIHYPVRTVLDTFCENLSKDSDADASMSKKGLYSLALFYTDLASKIHKEEKNSAGAHSEDKTSDAVAPAGVASGVASGEVSPDSTGSETNAGESTSFDPSATESENLFHQWIIGEPFVTSSDYEVPVRFIATDFFVDLYVFFIKEESAWKIDQLQVHRWGEVNGTK